MKTSKSPQFASDDGFLPGYVCSGTIPSLVKDRRLLKACFVKQKHYPYLTIAGMAVLVAVPFFLVVSIRNAQLAATDDEVEDLLASVNVADSENTTKPKTQTDNDVSDDSSPTDVVAKAAKKPERELPLPNFFETRVAMAPTVIPPTTEFSKPTTVPDSPALKLLDEPRALDTDISAFAPINVTKQKLEVPAPVVRSKDSKSVSHQNRKTTEVAKNTKDSSDLLSKEMQQAMSLRTPVTNGMGSSALPVGDSKSMANAKSDLFQQNPFAQKTEENIVDVLLQQPSESRRVRRVENVVAHANQPGWPIALVKSDLPDDQWWVQQMVGIRGNLFAARVNFGNQNSLPGGVYHMVFVFLDSQDEVRRFRIAKQFKELPEGVRRSRQFTFKRR